MTVPDLVLPASVAVLLVVVVLGGWLLWRGQRAAEGRAAHALATARSEAEELRGRLDALTATLEAAEQQGRAEAAEPEWVITSIDQPEPTTPTRIEGRLFADIVLRETVVKAAALGHGVRRALTPETRNRIRFEMRQESKRLRKERQVTARRLQREAAARQRARLAAEERSA